MHHYINVSNKIILHSFMYIKHTKLCSMSYELLTLISLINRIYQCTQIFFFMYLKGQVCRLPVKMPIKNNPSHHPLKITVGVQKGRLNPLVLSRTQFWCLTVSILITCLRCERLTLSYFLIITFIQYITGKFRIKLMRSHCHHHTVLRQNVHSTANKHVT